MKPTTSVEYYGTYTHKANIDELATLIPQTAVNVKNISMNQKKLKQSTWKYLIFLAIFMVTESIL